MGFAPLEIRRDQLSTASMATTASPVTAQGGPNVPVVADAPAGDGSEMVEVEDDPVTLFRDQPDLLAYAQAEAKRLRESGRRGSLAESDYESKIRCVALERMIQVYGESGNE